MRLLERRRSPARNWSVSLDAVDGVESSHGMDTSMWRAKPEGPQGPVQVSQKSGHGCRRVEPLRHWPDPRAWGGPISLASSALRQLPDAVSALTGVWATSTPGFAAGALQKS